MANLISPTVVRYEVIDPIRPRKTPKWSKWHVVTESRNDALGEVAFIACGKWICVGGSIADVEKANLRDVDASDVCQKCIHPVLLED